MRSARKFFWMVSFRILLLDLGNALVQFHSYVKVKVDPRLTIQWAHRDYGCKGVLGSKHRLAYHLPTRINPHRNEASCSMQCLWTDCPGFKCDNQACNLLESNQTLLIATRSNGTTIFIREEFIRQEESVLVYNHKIWHEFIPSSSPLSGFPLAFPDPPIGPRRILMDFPWGFHLCSVHEGSCYRWYFGTDDWIPMPALSVPHIGVLDMIQFNQTWWTLGGFWEKQLINNTGSLHRISEYMDEAGRWHIGPEYLDRYFEGLATISDTSLLAVGGARLPQRLKSSMYVVTEFDVSTGTSTHRFQIPCKMFGTTCSPFESQNGTKMVLCLGGSCPKAQPALQTSVFTYNIETGDWMQMPEWEFPERVRFSNLVWFQGTLFVLGGRYDQSDWNTIYKFDQTEHPAWTVIGTLPDDEGDYANARTVSRSIVVL